MKIDTEALADYYRSYRTCSASLGGSLDSTTKQSLLAPINNEVSKLNGLVFCISALLKIVGLENANTNHGPTIKNPGIVIGVRPKLGFVSLGNYTQDEPLGTLVFKTLDVDELNVVDPMGVIPIDIAQTFPFVAVPIEEPHHLEAIAIDY